MEEAFHRERWINNHSVYQVSVIDALMQGVMEGVISAKEMHPQDGICTFRADIDVSTCGKISPLNALNFLLRSFDADIVVADYRVRGFTRDVNGKKIFIDHRINSIQNYIAPQIRHKYDMVDVNVYQENLFHTKMMLRDFHLDNYLFHTREEDLPPKEVKRIRRLLKQEMAEIFNGRNMPAVKD